MLFILVIQFGHGQSNPTFLIEVGSGSSLKRYVLRKKPPGKLLQSAHAVDREFQVSIFNPRSNHLNFEFRIFGGENVSLL